MGAGYRAEEISNKRQEKLGDRNGMIEKVSGYLLLLSALQVRVRISEERQSEEDKTLKKQTEGLRGGSVVKCEYYSW